jgi:hypothetical protein
MDNKIEDKANGIIKSKSLSIGWAKVNVGILFIGNHEGTIPDEKIALTSPDQ